MVGLDGCKEDRSGGRWNRWGICTSTSNSIAIYTLFHYNAAWHFSDSDVHTTTLSPLASNEYYASQATIAEEVHPAR